MTIAELLRPDEIQEYVAGRIQDLRAAQTRGRRLVLMREIQALTEIRLQMVQLLGLQKRRPTTYAERSAGNE